VNSQYHGTAIKVKKGQAMGYGHGPAGGQCLSSSSVRAGEQPPLTSKEVLYNSLIKQVLPLTHGILICLEWGRWSLIFASLTENVPESDTIKQ